MSGKVNLRERLDNIFSTFIRLKHSDHAGFVSCYTCGERIHWKSVDCGHFIRRANSSVRFDEMNCKPQCVICNRMKSGMEESFEENLRDDFGDKAIDNLIKKGMSEKNYSDDEYKELIHFYSCKIKEKGVTI